MKLLVTGAGGQLARSLAERAADRVGIELICVGRPQLDLEVPGSAAAVIRRLAPDAVINAAAYTDVDRAEDEPELAMRVNGEAAGEVGAVAGELRIPIVQMSTDYVFDGSEERPYAEEAVPAPLGAYGRSKLAGELAVRTANPGATIVRTAWVYSPFGRNFVKTMFDAAESRDELRVVADQHGSPTSALDLADGLLAMVDSGRGGGETYHLAGSGEASWHEVAVAVMEERSELGLRTARVVPISTEEWPTKARRPRNSLLDSRKFAREFGFEMPHWRTSVARVVALLAGAR